jgi:hypothetical protein
MTFFWEIFLEYFWKKISKKSLKIFKISLYYFVEVCVKFFPKICHFQSFPSPFTSLFMIKNNGYKFLYITFKGPNVNELISYFEIL